MRFFYPLLLLLAFSVLSYSQETDIKEQILSLHKGGKLFDKTQYKEVRKVAAKHFETKHTKAIEKAFGSDAKAMETFFEKNLELKEELYTAITEKDNVPKVLSVFHDLWKADAIAVAKYPNLAIAISVVWDQPRNLYDYTQHQTRTKSKLPDEVGKHDHLTEFKYFVSHAKSIQGKETINRLENLPWEFQVFMVDHRTPDGERDWAIKNYIEKRPMVGKIYFDIVYDKMMYETKSEACKLTGKDYTLQDIKTFGGVCAMQADFAARVGKSLAVPAIYVTGESNSRELHAWVMWVEVKSASKNSITFSLESDGRYLHDQYYTGELIDPQTGQPTLDRDIERRLNDVANNRSGKRQAEIAMEFLPLIAEANEFDSKKKTQYLDSVLRLSVYNEAAWLELVKLVADKKFAEESKQIVFSLTERMLTVFAKYPDFSWQVGPKLVEVQPNRVTKANFFDRLTIMYENAKRPDLACQARLVWAEMMIEDKKYGPAATGLSNTAKKFSDEGRYVPKLTAKMAQIVPEHKPSKELLAQTYVELVRKMPAKRGTDIRPDFVKMVQEATTFLKAEKKMTELATVQQIVKGHGIIIKE